MTVLAVARDLFAALDQQGVRYCHWKSNEHVAAGLSGHTDLDVLIDRRHAARGLEILGRCGFKRFEATVGMGYPAVEDHVALDQDSGRFLHCHLHYRLVAGERRFKGYRLPWEDLLLERRVWDAEHGLYVADPDFEILILLVRYAVKLRTLDVLRHALGRSFFLRRGFLAEYEWLRRRMHPQECLCLCTELLGSQASIALAPLLEGPPSLSALRRFRHAARAELETLRSHGRLAGTALQCGRTLAWVATRISRRYFRLPVPLRRTLPTGGVLVALVGGDGPAKSTLLRELTRVLRGKVDVFEVSLGRGRAARSSVRSPTGQGDGKHPSRSHVRGGEALGLIAWSLVRAREKRRRLWAAWRARNMGMVVIADGYPQARVPGLDGSPLLSGYADQSSKLLRWLSRREAVPYAWGDRHPPDILIRLNVPGRSSVTRPPEMALGEHERQSGSGGALTYPSGTRVVEIDADRPLAEVIQDVKAAVWNQL
jgi:hypothetical protein